MAFSLTGRTSSVEAEAAKSETAPEYAPGQLIVGLDPSVADALELLLGAIDGSILASDLGGNGVVLISVPVDTDIPATVRKAAQLPFVTYAEPDHVVTIQLEAPVQETLDPPILVVCPPPEPCLPKPYLLDTRFETLLAGDGVTISGYVELTVGPGFSSRNEYDADFNLRSSEYRDSRGARSITVRETLVEDGVVVGHIDTSSGSGEGCAWKSRTCYDAAFNLVEATYADNQGYQSTTSRSEILDESTGELTGYEVTSRGGGNGYTYHSVETFDASYRLLSSEYESGDYRSSYQLEPQFDPDTGELTGYVSTYTWSDGSGTYTFSNQFDANWNYVSGDSDTPGVVLDDGPTSLPLLFLDAQTVEADATSRAAAIGPAPIDSTSETGARLQGTQSDDVFLIDDARDRVRGNKAGDDTVMSETLSLDLSRRNLNGIEDAVLMGWSDLDLRGNRGDNELHGNAGDNRIDGGAGADTLFGGFGSDVFVIRIGQKGAADVVTDFTSGEDSIALLGSAFRRLFDADGELRGGVLGDRLLFDASSGELSFDRDGAAGRGTAKVIAVLVGVDEVTASDFTLG